MAKVKVKATKKKEEPIILVTNDDGFTAPGIHALVEAVKGLGKIVVVAPDKPLPLESLYACIKCTILGMSKPIAAVVHQLIV